MMLLAKAVEFMAGGTSGQRVGATSNQFRVGIREKGKNGVSHAAPPKNAALMV